MSFTGFYTEYEPFKNPFSLVQITVKTSHQYKTQNADCGRRTADWV